MVFDPTSLKLDEWFEDPDMFRSRKSWRKAGFDVRDPAKDSECMVASHPSAPDYLFKKYPDDFRSQHEQRENFAARLEGSVRLGRFIDKHGLIHIKAPRKHVHVLPRTFGRDNQVLIVERLDIVGTKETEDRFHDITEPVLRELITVLAAFRGLDSNSKNVQFTTDGKIAFVDLENWQRAWRKEVRLRSIGTYLSKRGRKRAARLLDDV
jgi:hypothetical protein